MPQLNECLYKLCGEQCHDGTGPVTDTNPLANLTNDEFKVYVGFVLWGIVLLAGLGMEGLVWVGFFVYTPVWHVVSMSFSLLAATSLGLAIHHNYLALPIMVVGLWKFGFPETVLYYHCEYTIIVLLQE